MKEKVPHTAPDQPRYEPWRVVRRLADLAAIFPDVVFPLGQGRGEEVQREGERGPAGRRGAPRGRGRK